MQRADFFADIYRWDWPPFGLHVPLFFPALSSIAAVFTGLTTEVTRLLPDKRLKPVEVMPGRSLVSIAAVEYRESDLGAYNELAILLPVAFGRHSLPALDVLWRGLGRALNVYVWQIAVTSQHSREVGAALASYPKYVADVRFDREGSRVRCALAHDGQPALALICDAEDTVGERDLKVRAYTMKQGVPLVSTMLVRQTRWRDHLQRDAARLELFEGLLADTLRQLQLSDRPLASQCCSQAQAMLFFPRNVIDD
ncbi:MAG TPA: acetoacetate decarboxylase family protein [Burkholderiaceae bacterium]|nr:acetoacetate decarboxylase family protein [Burkholderiaceae bacterium]